MCGYISCYEKCSFRTETTLATMKLIKTHGVLALKTVTKILECDFCNSDCRFGFLVPKNP